MWNPLIAGIFTHPSLQPPHPDRILEHPSWSVPQEARPRCKMVQSLEPGYEAGSLETGYRPSAFAAGPEGGRAAELGRLPGDPAAPGARPPKRRRRA